jgi:peptide-methionine (S)-S-oxide reductase
MAVLLRSRQCYHQQYLSDAKNPNGYCGLGGTGVTCPVDTAVESNLAES